MKDRPINSRHHDYMIETGCELHEKTCDVLSSTGHIRLSFNLNAGIERITDRIINKVIRG